MSQRSSGPARPGSDEWPDDLWPDDDDDGAPGNSWPDRSMPPGWPGDGSPRRWLNPTTLAVVAVVAVVAGAGIALAVQVFGSPAARPFSFQQASTGPGAGGQPGQGGQGSGPVSGLPASGFSGTGQAFVIGTVIKVSATSITIGGPGHTITAGIIRSTRISGKVSAIGGLKAGDQVSAQISASNGKATVVALQYPAQAPPGGVPGG